MIANTSSLDRKTLLSLVDASRAINSELGAAEVFRKIVEHASSVLNSTGASVLLLDADRGELSFQAATGPGAEQLVGERFDMTLGIAGQAVRTRRAIRVDDVHQNRNFFAGIDEKTEQNTRCLLAAPLIHAGNVLGVLEVVNPLKRTHFSDQDLELLKVFANLASTAAANAQAFDRMAKDLRGLREARPKLTLVGQSEALDRVLALGRKVAGATVTVLLYGETGTGKELVARAIHDFSERGDNAFIAINCAALPESLLESELFGHEKGAFTGAVARKLGRFELAEGGTLFLDEIAELSPSIQAKLLRVLEQREIIRVGGTQTVICDVRVIAATNRDLKEATESGQFRTDLYYRLNVFPITLPTLRDRLEDLPLLADHFISQIASNMRIESPVLTDTTISHLMRYQWPGNVRELRNAIERGVLLAEQGEICPEHLPTEITEANSEVDQIPSTGTSRLAKQERAMIYQALEQAGWNQSAAARKLGVSRDYLRHRVRKHQLKRPSRG